MMSSIRTYLTETEVDSLIKAANATSYPARNHCLVLMMFRHGLRVSEACQMKCSSINLDARVIQVSRMKNGFSTIHPIKRDEAKVIRTWLDSRAKMKGADSDALFLSNQGRGISRKTVWMLLKDLGEKAKISIPTHPHMLRHACGYALANQGADTRLIQDYLGHISIGNTVKYTASNPARFARLW